MKRFNSCFFGLKLSLSYLLVEDSFDLLGFADLPDADLFEKLPAFSCWGLLLPEDRRHGLQRGRTSSCSTPSSGRTVAADGISALAEPDYPSAAQPATTAGRAEFGVQKGIEPLMPFDRLGESHAMNSCRDRNEIGRFGNVAGPSEVFHSAVRPGHRCPIP